jgi:hypothetical protein
MAMNDYAGHVVFVRLHDVVLLDCYECILTLAALTLHLMLYNAVGVNG